MLCLMVDNKKSRDAGVRIWKMCKKEIQGNSDKEERLKRRMLTLLTHYE